MKTPSNSRPTRRGQRLLTLLMLATTPPALPGASPRRGSQAPHLQGQREPPPPAALELLCDPAHGQRAVRANRLPPAQAALAPGPVPRRPAVRGLQRGGL